MAIAHDAVHHNVDPNLPVEYSTEDGQLKILGFWLFMVSDLLLFACLFATYVVMRTHYANGPTPHQIFSVPGFTEETFALLTSSFTCGLAMYQARKGKKNSVAAWLIVTILLGLCFIGLEVAEFVGDVSHGFTMDTSGFLSAFFTLVGTHGCHVSLGILWMSTVMFQILRRGITPVTARKLFIVSLYWHFLDVVWVFLFTVVYLTGVM